MGTRPLPADPVNLVYRSAGNESDPPVLLVHGYPESSYSWRGLMEPLAEAGYNAIAPDLAGFGDSPPNPPGTWERHSESLAALYNDLDLDPVVLVVHDWGSLIGLRFACDHPEAIRALVISNGGFFADGSWHALAQSLRTPGTGEELLAGFTQEGFGAMMAQLSPGIDERAIAEYWKSFADEERRRGHLELYRSGDFDKLIPYEGKLAALGVPTLIVWGANDPFVPVAAAHRFQAEIPGSELVLLEDAGHFVWEDAPQQAAAALTEFLARAAPR